MRLGRRAACLAAVCAFMPGSVQAALWAADPSLEVSSGADDNYGLAFDRRNRVGVGSMTAGLGAARETETSTTRLDAALVGLLLRGDIHQNEFQDRLSLTQTLAAPLDSFAFHAKTVRDETLQTPASSADVLIGRGIQRNVDGDASWEHHVTERLGTSASLAVERTRYSASLAGARDYQNGSGSFSLRYLLDERDSVNANLIHQDYRTLDNETRSLTDSVTVGGSRALSETSTVSAQLGAYRNRSAVLQAVLICADGAVGCAQPIVVAQVGRLARWGAQYNASYGGQLTERTKFSSSAVRQQDPSGAGVTVVSDTLRVGVEHSVSETLGGELAFTHSTARYQGLVSGQASRLETLEASMSKALSPRFTLRANMAYRRSEAPFDGLRANSLGASITLRYEWQRLEAHH